MDMILLKIVRSCTNLLLSMKYCRKIFIFLLACRHALSVWPMRARFVRPICVPRISMMFWLMPGSAKLMRNYTTWPILVLITRKVQPTIVGDFANFVEVMPLISGIGTALPTIFGRGHRPWPLREANMLGAQRRLIIAPALRALAAALPPLYNEKHRPPRAVAAVEGVWGERLSPHISSYGIYLTLSASVESNYCVMTGVDILLNHARVRTRFACACVYELIGCMSLNKQLLILYIMVKLLMLVFMFFFAKFIYKCILFILVYFKDWMDRY